MYKIIFNDHSADNHSIKYKISIWLVNEIVLYTSRLLLETNQVKDFLQEHFCDYCIKTL